MEVSLITRLKIVYLVLFKFLDMGGSTKNSASFICGNTNTHVLITIQEQE